MKATGARPTPGAHGHHQRLGHARVVDQPLLDALWLYVFTAGNEYVVEPPFDDERLLVVEVAPVTGGEPASSLTAGSSAPSAR